MVRRNFRNYEKPPTVTAFKSFPGRSHFLIAEPGWEEIADEALRWAAAAAQPADGRGTA